MSAATEARARQLRAYADHHAAVADFRRRREADQQAHIDALLSELVDALVPLFDSRRARCARVPARAVARFGAVPAVRGGGCGMAHQPDGDGGMSGRVIVLRGDAAHLPLPDGSVDLIVTSPPYWSMRDYRDGGESMAGQIGSERNGRNTSPTYSGAPASGSGL